MTRSLAGAGKGSVDNRTEQVADGVWRIECGFFVNAYLLADDGQGDGEGLTLVDTGTRAGGPRLVRSIRMLGLDPRATRRVLLTHWHTDHAGSAQRFATSTAGSSVAAPEEDLAVVRGDAAPRDALAAGAGRLARALHRVLPAPKPTPSATPLDTGLGDVAGGLVALATPGHTLGHTAFWLPAHGVLLAGDACHSVGRVSGWPKRLCADPAAAASSLAALARLPAAVLGPGHGPAVRAGVGRRLEAALARYR